jgi:hypothetical protein
MGWRAFASQFRVSHDPMKFAVTLSGAAQSMEFVRLGSRVYGVWMFWMRCSSDDINATARLKLLTQPWATAILE